jgi:CheY-like chemotaxis protein
MSGARILIAEDDPASLELVQAFLESHGYRVEVAPDGNRALELGCSGLFDLIVLDLHMPLYGGLEVLHMLRKRYLLRPIKVIALTGDVLPSVRGEVEREGIDAFLFKPVSLALLQKEIERVLSAPSAKRKNGSSRVDDRLHRESQPAD